MGPLAKKIPTLCCFGWRGDNVYCPVCGEPVNDQKGYIKHTQEKHTPEEMQNFISQQTNSIQMPTELVRAENFSKFYATNMSVNVTQFDLRIDIMNERREVPAGGRHPTLPVVQFLSEAQIIATPIAAKILQQQLAEAIDMLEREIGVIEIPN